jgi:hypothetical protein
MKIPKTYATEHGLTVEGASPELLAELLDTYAYEIYQRNPEAWEGMSPGLSPDDIVEELTAEDIPASEEATVWWSWTNGYRPDRPPLLSNPPLPLGSAIESYVTDRDIYKFELLPGPNWIRVTGLDRSTSIALHCDDGDGLPLVCRIAPAVKVGNGPHDLRPVVSLCTPVTWWLTALDKGWMRFDDHGYLRVPDMTAYPTEWRLTGLI